MTSWLYLVSKELQLKKTQGDDNTCRNFITIPNTYISNNIVYIIA